MPQRIVAQPIVLYVDGKPVRHEVGAVANLTQEQLDSINKANPKALRHIITGEDKPAAVKAVVDASAKA